MRQPPSRRFTLAMVLVPFLAAAGPVFRAADAGPAAGTAQPPDAPPQPPGAPSESPPPETGERQGPAAALPFSGQISGTVYSHAKRFVTGVSVAVTGTSGATIRGSSTDEDGRYAIKGLERDEYAVLVVEPDGALVRKDRVSVRPLFRNLVDFILAPPGAPQPPLPRLPASASAGSAGFTLDVTLRSREAQSVPEAWVIVSPLHEGTSSRRARTDTHGSARLEGLPPGYYRLSARALGHVTWSLGPLLMEGDSPKRLEVSLLPFPLGHEERIEDLLVPIEPATPDRFEAERPAQPGAASDPNSRVPAARPAQRLTP